MRLFHRNRIQRSTVDLIVKRLLQRDSKQDMESVARMQSFIAQAPDPILFRRNCWQKILNSAAISLPASVLKEDMEILYFRRARLPASTHDDLFVK